MTLNAGWTLFGELGSGWLERFYTVSMNVHRTVMPHRIQSVLCLCHRTSSIEINSLEFCIDSRLMVSASCGVEPPLIVIGFDFRIISNLKPSSKFSGTFYRFIIHPENSDGVHVCATPAGELFRNPFICSNRWTSKNKQRKYTRKEWESTAHRRRQQHAAIELHLFTHSNWIAITVMAL